MCLPPGLRDTATALLEVGDHLKVAHLPGVRGGIVSSLRTHLVQFGGEHLGAPATHSHGCCVLSQLASSLLFLGWEVQNISILSAAEKKDTHELKALGHPIHHFLGGQMSTGNLLDPHHGPDTGATWVVNQPQLAPHYPGEAHRLPQIDPTTLSLPAQLLACLLHCLATHQPTALLPYSPLQAAGIFLAAGRAETRSLVQAAQAWPCMENLYQRAGCRDRALLCRGRGSHAPCKGPLTPQS